MGMRWMAAAGLAMGVTAFGLGAGPVAAPAEAVPATVATEANHHACVAKKTGRMRWIRKGKCRRGEIEITWSRTGATGPQGPAGPAGATGATGPMGPRGYTPIVSDGSGTVLTDVIVATEDGIERLVSGGIYFHRLDGVVPGVPIVNAGMVFLTPDCSGTPWVGWEADQIPGGSQRRVIQGPDGATRTAYGFGSARLVLPVGSPVSRYTNLGAGPVCQADNLMGEAILRDLVALGAPPADLPGPITYSFPS